MHIRDQEQRSHRDLERPIDAAIYLRRHSTRFERQLLTINEQTRIEVYFSYPNYETELFSNLFHVNHDLEQEARFEEDDEIASRTVALGQTVQGTELRLLSLSELVDLTIERKGRLHAGESEDLDKFLQELKESAKSYPDYIKVHLSARDINRWKLAHRAIQTYIRTLGEHKERKWWDPDFEFNILVQRCDDLPGLVRIFAENDIATGFSLAAFIYGGLDALAWSAHFHSSVEQLLWRISACIVMGSLPFLYAGNDLRDYSTMWRNKALI